MWVKRWTTGFRAKYGDFTAAPLGGEVRLYMNQKGRPGKLWRDCGIIPKAVDTADVFWVDDDVLQKHRVLARLDV